MMWVWFVILIVFIAAVVIPLWAETNRKAIDATARTPSQGKFADLPMGVTRYRWSGSSRGPIAIAIHGLTTPSDVWGDLSVGLGDLGYRVLSYDLYGRGLSDAPSGKQDADFFTDQLTALMDHLEITDQVTLVGYSMGGSIATAFTAKHPDRVLRVVLLASAGIDTNESPFSKFCRIIPVIGDWAFMTFSPKRMKRSILSDPSAKIVPKVASAQLAELDRKGFLPAVLSSRRGLLADTLDAQHKLLGQKNIPVVAIWGGNDPVIPLTSVGRLAQLNRNARQDVIVAADHALPYSHAPEVIDALSKLSAD